MEHKDIKFDRGNLRMCLRFMYKQQNLRVKAWLQILSKLKADNPRITEEIKSKVTTPRKIEKDLLREYKSVETINEEGKSEDRKLVYIKDDLSFVMVQAYFELYKQEGMMLNIIKKTISCHPLLEYIKGIRGCDESTAAILLSEIDIYKSKYVSSLYLLSGLDCGPDGKARNKSEGHLVDREYTDRDGKIKIKKSITYNPFLHDKILGTIGPNLIRAKSLPYYETYSNYKHRLEMRPFWDSTSKMHRHRAATRYMMRTFMANLYAAWRAIEGLEVHQTYEFQKLGLDHWGNGNGTSPVTCDTPKSHELKKSPYLPKDADIRARKERKAIIEVVDITDNTDYNLLSGVQNSIDILSNSEASESSAT